MKVLGEDQLSFQDHNVIAKDQPSLHVDDNVQHHILKSPTLQLAAVSSVTDALLLAAAPAVRPNVLLELQVTCVVNAAAELPDTPLPTEPTITYLKVAVEDSSRTDLGAHLDAVADLIEQVRQQGGRTLVHCVAGVSRSATLVLAFLMKHERMSLRKAFTFLRARRPCVRPNVGFFRQLVEMERRLFGSTTVNMVHNAAAGGDIPDVYEPDYRTAVWFQQQYRRNFGRH